MVVVGAVGMALAGSAIASADPELSPVINTTCTYPPAVSALGAQDPATAQQFETTPAAQSWLTSFLGSPSAKRQQMIQQIQGSSDAQPYTGATLAIANTCKNY